MSITNHHRCGKHLRKETIFSLNLNSAHTNFQNVIQILDEITLGELGELETTKTTQNILDQLKKSQTFLINSQVALKELRKEMKEKEYKFPTVLKSQEIFISTKLFALHNLANDQKITNLLTEMREIGHEYLDEKLSKMVAETLNQTEKLIDATTQLPSKKITPIMEENKEGNINFSLFKLANLWQNLMEEQRTQTLIMLECWYQMNKNGSLVLK